MTLPANPLAPLSGNKPVNYHHLFRETWHIIQRQRVLWVVALLTLSLSTISNIGLRLGGRWAFSRLFINPMSLEGRLEQLFLQLGQPVPLVGGLVVLVGGVLLIWVVTTIGEAALIYAAAQAHTGHSPRFDQALRAGIRLLGPFVGIDTVVFFPLFGLLLAILLLAAAAMILGLLLGTRSGELLSLLSPLLIGGVLTLGLSLFILPLTLITMTFRTLAFRAAALQNLGVRESIHHTWQLIRHKTSPIIAVTALLFGLGYLLGLLTTIVLLPLSLIEGLPNLSALAAGLTPALFFSPLTIITTLINAGLSLGVQVAITVFTSTTWTITYQELIKEELTTIAVHSE